MKKPTHKTCKECGIKFYDNLRFDYCVICRTAEKETNRAKIRRNGRVNICKDCGGIAMGQAKYCPECRKKRPRGLMYRRTDGGIQKLTLDITLFFMIVRGMSVKEAAYDQQLKPSVLQQYLDEQTGKPKYERLKAYYEREREERRKAA